MGYTYWANWNDEFAWSSIVCFYMHFSAICHMKYNVLILIRWKSQFFNIGFIGIFWHLLTVFHQNGQIERIYQRFKALPLTPIDEKKEGVFEMWFIRFLKSKSCALLSWPYCELLVSLKSIFYRNKNLLDRRKMTQL